MTEEQLDAVATAQEELYNLLRVSMAYNEDQRHYSACKLADLIITDLMSYFQVDTTETQEG
jgi:hypothetical protein